MLDNDSQKKVGRTSIGTHDLLRVDLQNIVLVDLCPGLVIPRQQKISYVNNRKHYTYAPVSHHHSQNKRPFNWLAVNTSQSVY